MKVRIPWAARLAVSTGLLAAIAYFVPVADLAAAARAVPPWLAAAVLAGFLLGHAVAAVKWWWLMAPHADVPLRLAVRAHFAGLTANLCLPGIAGGDVVRAAWVMRHTDGRAGVGVASVADRLLDCMALLVLSSVGVLVTAEWAGPIGTALPVAASVVALPWVVGVVGYVVLRRTRRGGLLGRVADALAVLAQHPGTLVRGFALSLLIQGGFVGLNVALGRAAGVEASAGAWLVAWPLAKLIALVPVSLNGLGVREAALVFFMRPFGASAAAVTASSLLWQALLTVGSLVGGLAVATPGRVTAPVREEAAVP